MTNLVCVKLLQSCPTLWDATDCSPPGSSVHGILQARYSNGSLCPSPGDFPYSGIKSASLSSSALAGRLFFTSTTWETHDSVLKCRDITWPTEVHTVNAIDFLVVMYGCESWTTEHKGIDAF